MNISLLPPVKDGGQVLSVHAMQMKMKPAR